MYMFGDSSSFACAPLTAVRSTTNWRWQHLHVQFLVEAQTLQNCSRSKQSLTKQTRKKQIWQQSVAGKAGPGTYASKRFCDMSSGRNGIGLSKALKGRNHKKKKKKTEKRKNTQKKRE